MFTLFSTTNVDLSLSGGMRNLNLVERPALGKPKVWVLLQIGR